MELNLFIPLVKVDSVHRLVYGIATCEAVDKSNEVCDYETTKPLYQKWSDEIFQASGGKSYGNIRSMHSKVAAGKVAEPIVFDDSAKKIMIVAKVVDDEEWKKVEEGVYTGFSQGGRYVKRWADTKQPNVFRYTAEPLEVSLVDNPCLGDATFTYVKADGAEELRKFHAPTTEAPKVEAKTEVVETGAPKGPEATLTQVLKEVVATPAEITKAIELCKAEFPNRDPKEELFRAPDNVTVVRLWSTTLAKAREELAKTAAQPKQEGKPNEQGQSAVAKTVAGQEVGSASTHGSTAGSEPVVELEQVWKAKDGKTFAKKADAVKHNEELDIAAAVQAATGSVDKSIDALKTALEPKPAASASETNTVVPPEQTDAEKASAAAMATAAAKKKKKRAYKFKSRLAIKKDAKDDERIVQVRKSMYDIGCVARIICDLHYLQDCLEYEAAVEEDNSPQPEKLREIVAELCMFLRALAEEETAEIMSGYEADVEAAAGFGAFGLLKNLKAGEIKAEKFIALLEGLVTKASKADMVHLQSAHDHVAAVAGGDTCGDMGKSSKMSGQLQAAHDILKGMGTDCAGTMENAAHVETGSIELRKAVAVNDALTKRINEILPVVESLTKRVKDLEDQPLPPKGVVRAVAKGADAQRTGGDVEVIEVGKMSDEQVAQEFMKLPEHKRTELLMKAALSQGVPVDRRGFSS